MEQLKTESSEFVSEERKKSIERIEAYIEKMKENSRRKATMLSKVHEDLPGKGEQQ
jgi:hypothetical protein